MPWLATYTEVIFARRAFHSVRVLQFGQRQPTGHVNCFVSAKEMGQLLFV